MKRTIVVLALLVAACAVPGPREPDRYFVLEPARMSPAVPSNVAVRVLPTTAASFYDTQDLVYSRTPGTRAYYQFNHWTERPQDAIRAAIAARFATAGTRDAPALETRVDEIYHDASTTPGVVLIALSARLVDANGRVLAERSFRRAEPAPSYDAAGAVQGLRRALATIVDELVAWVEMESPRFPAPRS